jgi:hypothetical protein
MKNDNFVVVLMVSITVILGVYSAYDGYKTRNENIIEFALNCIDNDYNEVHQEQYISLNPLDYIKVNRAQKRLIWISDPKIFNSYSDYVVYVTELKDPKTGATRSYYLKRKGHFFYFEAYGEEFDYKVKVSDARNANLSCSIIDIWIKDHL